MKVDFYHLTLQPIDRVLPAIAEKVLATGERLLIVAEDQTLCAALDRLLWEYAPDSFLPHAIAGTDADGDQPVLIARDVQAANGAGNVVLADGTWRDAALEFARAFHLFDEQRIAEARAAWKALATREDVERRYWKQDERGRWHQAA